MASTVQNGIACLRKGNRHRLYWKCCTLSFPLRTFPFLFLLPSSPFSLSSFPRLSFPFPPPIFPLSPAYLSPYPLLFPLQTSPFPSLSPFLQITPFSSFHPTHKITLTKRLVLSLLLTRIASLTRCFITKVYQVRKWRGSP